MIGAAIASVLAFLKEIPWKAWAALVVFVLVVLAFWAYGNSRYTAGQAERQGAWDAASTAQAQADRNAQDEQAKATLITVTEYVDRVQTIRVKGDTVVQKVPVYIPSDSPLLPGGWRLLHDAAAQGVVPPPPGSVAAEAVGAQDAARTVLGNYATCHIDHAGYESLWEWAERQAEVGGS
jgi:hypothetical protein